MFYNNFILMVLVTSALGNHCDKLGILIYEDLGCKPNKQVCDDTCPTKYVCKGLEPTSKNCIFRGKTYQEKEEVNSKISSLSCQPACYCQTELDKSHFTCAALECPEWLAGQIAPGCYWKYSLDHCCSAGTNCPPFHNLATCQYGGITYRDGEKFYPEKTCLKCVCQKGFKGKLVEPFCRRFDCGTQLQGFGLDVQSSCAPFYAANLTDILCCPDHWICPDGTEVIEGSTKLGDTCKFGNKTLSVGQKFGKTGVKDNYGRTFDKVECECVVPPLLRCLKA